MEATITGTSQEFTYTGPHLPTNFQPSDPIFDPRWENIYIPTDTTTNFDWMHYRQPEDDLSSASSSSEGSYAHSVYSASSDQLNPLNVSTPTSKLNSNFGFSKIAFVGFSVQYYYYPLLYSPFPPPSHLPLHPDPSLPALIRLCSTLSHLRRTSHTPTTHSLKILILPPLYLPQCHSPQTMQTLGSIHTSSHRTLRIMPPPTTPINPTPPEVTPIITTRSATVVTIVRGVKISSRLISP
jgi:hypothetical protein